MSVHGCDLGYFTCLCGAPVLGGLELGIYQVILAELQHRCACSRHAFLSYPTSLPLLSYSDVRVLCLRTTLPFLFAEFERCQRSLEGYIERKRTKFPRLYFVSNPVLLQILSLGSDPKAIGPFYDKMFDAVTAIVIDKAQPSKLTSMRHVIGKDYEDVSFVKPVTAGACTSLCVVTYQRVLCVQARLVFWRCDALMSVILQLVTLRNGSCWWKQR